MLNGWKTLTGLAVAFIAQALQMSGVDLGADPEAVTDLINVTATNVLTLVGIGIGVYGRVVAKRKLLTDEKLK